MTGESIPRDEGLSGSSQRNFNIIGSGVIGLLVANELAGMGHAVKVISREGKPDIGTDSASSNAVGQFLPWLPEGHEGLTAELDLERVVAHSREFYADLARIPEQTGVMAVRNVELVKSGFPWPEGLPEAMNTTVR